jgi:hypothetical protein
MVDPIAETNQAEEDLEPGTTRVLTADGWELVPYVDPEDTWELRDDGSWLAPDGLTRSWPIAGPDPPAPGA